MDMYKTCTKEQREKAQIMVNEKKTRAELEDVSFSFVCTVLVNEKMFFAGAISDEEDDGG